MLAKRFVIYLIAFTPQVLFCQMGWYQLVTGTSNNLRSVYFTDINTGYAVGFSGTILKTTNGGINWVLQQSPAAENLNSVYFKGQTGFAVGGSNTPVIIKTTNGGINWVSQAISGTYDLASVFMIDSVTVHASGRSILKTTNGGINWNIQLMDAVLGYPAYFNSIFFANTTTGFAGGSNLMHYGGAFVKTTNGGINWYMSSVPRTSVYFINSETGYGTTGGEYTIHKTTNSGQNWTTQNLGTGNFLSSVWFTGINTGYIAGVFSNNGIIFKSTNAGTNWNQQTIPQTGGLYSIFFIDANTGYAAGNSGTILKTTNGGISGLSLLNNEIPAEYNLEQNYPNPFNPKTNIKFHIAIRVFVRLVVFDILAKEAAILVNEELSPGIYEADFDGSKLASGIYYYLLQSENYSAVKKMALIK